MRIGLIVIASAMIVNAAWAQQSPIPLTDWRTVVDSDLSKISMPRDAHMAITYLMQAYERQAQAQRTPPTTPVEPPKN